MLTILPWLCSRIWGTTALQVRNCDFKLTIMTESQSSSVILEIHLSRAIPTLFTSMSTRPKRSIVCAISDSAPSFVLTSATTGTPSAPSASSSLPTCSIFSGTMSFSTTFAPARASFRAIPAPIPWPEPVTTAMRLLSCMSVPSSTSLELRLALLDERLHALHAILAGSQRRMALRLEGEPGVQVRVECLVDGCLDPSERQGCALCDLRGQCQGLLHQGRVCHDPVDQPHAHRLVGAGLPTEEHELFRPSSTDQTGQALGTARARHAADLGLRKAELCPL